jgi:hypothetical protein
MAWGLGGTGVHRSGNGAAAIARSRWLGELALAVDQARQLASQLGAAYGRSEEGIQLCARLDAVRLEVEALRRGHRGVPQREIDPRWINLFAPGRRQRSSALDD